MRLFCSVIFALLAMFSNSAGACRPQMRSPAELAKMSPAIFIGRVIAIHPLKTGNQEIEIAVKEALKGFLPQTIRLNAEGLIDPNEFCKAIEEPALPKPHVSEGQEWLIFGNFDTATNSLLLTWHGYPASDETTILKELRQELGKGHKQVQKKAP